jgi:hypothetical protein
MKFVGANPSATVAGADELPGKSSYYLGNDPKKWQTGIPNYARVQYRGIYPGIDLVYHGNQGGQLEYDFVVAPGGDPSAIVLDVGAGLVPAREGHPRGVPLQIAVDGDLVVKADGGDLRFHKPMIYQPAINSRQRITDHGQRTPIEGHYILQANNQVGFKVAAYDHTKPLIIDPVLAYSTYTNLDGLGAGALGIGVDSSGNAYVLAGSGAGATTQTVVLALNPQGNQFVYTTYLGPTGTNGPRAIAVDPQGDAYITGSGVAGFPTTAGAFSATCPSICNTPFAAKFSPAGTLEYATFLGPSNAQSSAIAVDASGDAYITGAIASSDLPAVNAFQPVFVGDLCDGCSNAFVQKLNPSGSQLLYSTYLGGGFGNYGYNTAGGTGIAVDSTGSAYVVGNTESPLFPIKNALEPVQISYYGDAFLTKFTPDGSGLVYSTFLGGSGGAPGDTAVAVAVDASGNAYVTGNAASADFPTTMNAFQASCYEPATDDCIAPPVYVLKVDPNGAALLYSTLLGVGTAASIVLDSSGGAWVASTTSSNYFPVIQPIESGLQQNSYPESNADAFVIRLNSSGIPTFSTYLGGSFSGENGASVAVDSSGDAYVAGSTGVGNDTPVDFPTVNPAPGTQQAAQFYYPGAVFAAKISPGAGPALSLSPWYTNILELRDVSDSPLTINSITPSSTLTLEGGTCGSSLPAGGGCTLIVYPENPQSPSSGTLTISSNSLASPQTFNINYSQIGTNQFFVSRDYLEFPAQVVGSSGAAQAVTLTNLYYPNPVAITRIATSVADPSEGISGDFTQTNNCPALLVAGASCTVMVQYQPTEGSDGLESGQLQIVTGTSPTNYIVYLNGIRSSSSLVASGGSNQLGRYNSPLQFGTQFAGTTALPRVVSLTNVSTQQVSLSGFTVTGPFSQTNNCPGALAPEASCRVSVSFTPVAGGSFTGTVAVANSGEGSPTVINLAGTGTTGLSASPASLSFGFIAPGTTASLPLTLTYVGGSTLSFLNFVLTPDFTQTNNCGGSLAPGASCTVTVNFTPSIVGFESGTLTIPFSALGSPLVVSLSGQGASAMAITPWSLGFEEVPVGQTSGEQALTLDNGGPPLTISSISISGDFGIAANSCPTPPATLAALATCTLQVVFTPTAAGSRSGAVTVIASDSTAPHVVALGGTGAIMPEVTLTPGSLSFGTVQAGSTSAPQTVTMTNVGNATLTIAGMVASGDYAQTNTCGGSLAASANCTISITFTPASNGQTNANLTITDNAAGSPQVVALSGSVTGPVLTLVPSSLSFTATLVGTGAGYEEVTMLSNGNGPVTITNVTASGDFSVNNTCPSVLGGSCPLEVGFNPTAGGTRTGTLTVTDNAYGSPQTIPLTGTGIDFNVATASGSPSTQTVSPGQTASYSLALSGTAQFSSSVSLTCSGAPALATCTVNPNAVLLNGTNVLNATVTVTTTAASGVVVRPQLPAPPWIWLWTLALLGAVGVWMMGVRRCAWRRAWAPLAVVTLGLMLWAACGGGGGGGGAGPPVNPGTPAGTYPLTVTGTYTSGASTLQHNLNLTLIVN